MTTPIEPPDATVTTLAARAREAAAAPRNAAEKEEQDSSETQGDEDSGRLIVMLDEYPAFAPSADPSEVASNFARRVSLSSVAPNAAELMWPSAETKE
ncbi:hypothetical protein RQN9TF_31310 (plasmid) [Rhodococcus qingshengii]|uniref:hypothetical protein n=1 Tax=Rhodococcus qingshengii TaxID=334542 RepID=UPI0021FCB45B|nr:hypothetical protein [Rhodococcus qingshengii]BDQ23743.1 hypothetical protein RQN9TF_31310 [Rhodococcus qingshengii]